MLSVSALAAETNRIRCPNCSAQEVLLLTTCPLFRVINSPHHHSIEVCNTILLTREREVKIHEIQEVCNKGRLSHTGSTHGAAWSPCRGLSTSAKSILELQNRAHNHLITCIHAKMHAKMPTYIIHTFWTKLQQFLLPRSVSKHTYIVGERKLAYAWSQCLQET